MRYIKFVFVILALIVQSFSSMYVAQAASVSVMISQVQTGGSGTGTAGQEFVELYNRGMQDVDVTGWCATYSSAADGSPSTIACISAPDGTTRVWLKAGMYATFVSPDYKNATGFGGDGLFTYAGGMAGTGGHLRLLDGSKNEVDRLGWGTASHSEGASAPAPAGGKVLQRNGLGGMLQDTDDNAADFAVAAPTMHAGGLYEVMTIVDVCPNLDGAQAAVPDGLIVDASGVCVVPPPHDECPNVAGMQADVPYGNAKDGDGNCVYDACVNIDGVQAVIPDGYESLDSYDCTLQSYTIELTELLPNPAGADSGNEFAELYNPNPFPVKLSGYIVQFGANFEKSYNVPGYLLQPGEYVAFGNQDIGYTLVNSQSRVRLVAPAGVTVSETPLYANPPDGQSWALIDGVWQYTNRSTPGAANLASAEDEVSDTAATASACPAGKYRNPLTNRCRNIEADAAVIAACDVDQYRNPETGRCKKIATVGGLTPCKDGQYRSEETNRCRNIEAASANLTPCKEGQERNPDTNRCRNVAATSVPNAAFAVQPVADSAKAFVGWWALGGVGVAALGYAGWEWRREVLNVIRKVPFIKF